jgi:NitT/TauT family transport system substrate-binding protein
MNIVMWPDELWPNHSCCRMLAQTSWMNENPDTLKKLLRAYLKAERDIAGNKAMMVDMVMEKLDMTREIAESFLLSPHLIYDIDPFKNSVIKMWDTMLGFGYLVEPGIDVRDHINTDIYKSALDSLVAEYPGDPFFQGKLNIFNDNNL